MSARDDMLTRIRTILARPDLPFPPADAPPLTAATRMAVTQAMGDKWQLAERFGAELEKLHGSFEVFDSPVAVRLALVSRLRAWAEIEEAERKGPKLETGQEQIVLTWQPELLPVPGLAETLADTEWRLMAPRTLTTPESRDAVRFVRVGITGVDAAFAATGSMLLISAPGASRAASLLPLRHIALIPFSRLYANVETFLAERRADGNLAERLRDPAAWHLITGPSKSADIEMNLTLGVHGPKFVHAILFEDQ
jgi:L-lactate dehydrogenase complex protein LldG